MNKIFLKTLNLPSLVLLGDIKCLVQKECNKPNHNYNKQNHL
jgi:hypothetical protein